MIIVKIIGGLGNQMFQYAIGRRIAYLNHETLKLDISGFETYNPWNYGLNHFNIIENIATESDIQSFKRSNNKYINNIFQVMEKRFYLPCFKNKVVYEKSLDYDFSVLNYTNDVYLNGYWQSEKYFKDIDNIIRNDFIINTSPTLQNNDIAKEIRNVEAICLHVRRGDYVSNPHVNEIIGICPLDYYYRAIDHIMSKVENPHFFIFSDDPTWTQQNVKIDAPTTYICNNSSNKNYEDLRLMASCKHFIIANSSFSWWGAWLSSNEEKIVIAPAQWFAGINYNDDDRLPKEWIRLHRSSVSATRSHV